MMTNARLLLTLVVSPVYAYARRRGDGALHVARSGIAAVPYLSAATTARLLAAPPSIHLTPQHPILLMTRVDLQSDDSFTPALMTAPRLLRRFAAHTRRAGLLNLAAHTRTVLRELEAGLELATPDLATKRFGVFTTSGQNLRPRESAALHAWLAALAELLAAGGADPRPLDSGILAVDDETLFYAMTDIIEAETFDTELASWIELTTILGVPEGSFGAGSLLAGLALPQAGELAIDTGTRSFPRGAGVTPGQCRTMLVEWPAAS